TTELVVEHFGSHLEQEVRALRCPAHLLLLDHALADDLVDHRLDEGARNHLAVPIPLTIVRDPGAVGSEVAAELSHRLQHLALVTTGTLVIQIKFEAVYGLEGFKQVAVPQEPLQACQSCSTVSTRRESSRERSPLASWLMMVIRIAMWNQSR